MPATNQTQRSDVLTSAQLRDSSLEDRQGLFAKDWGARAHCLRGRRRQLAGSRAATAASAAARRKSCHALHAPAASRGVQEPSGDREKGGGGVLSHQSPLSQ